MRAQQSSSRTTRRRRSPISTATSIGVFAAALLAVLLVPRPAAAVQSCTLKPGYAYPVKQGDFLFHDANPGDVVGAIIGAAMGGSIEAVHTSVCRETYYGGHLADDHTQPFSGTAWDNADEICMRRREQTAEVDIEELTKEVDCGGLKPDSCSVLRYLEPGLRVEGFPTDRDGWAMRPKYSTFSTNWKNNVLFSLSKTWADAYQVGGWTERIDGSTCSEWLAHQGALGYGEGARVPSTYTASEVTAMAETAEDKLLPMIREYEPWYSFVCPGDPARRAANQVLNAILNRCHRDHDFWGGSVHAISGNSVPAVMFQTMRSGGRTVNGTWYGSRFDTGRRFKGFGDYYHCSSGGGGGGGDDDWDCTDCVYPEAF